MFDSLKASLNESLRPILPVPFWQKVLFLLATGLLIAGAYLYLGWMPLQEEIAQQQSQLKVQQVRLIKNQRLAHNLPRKQKEYQKLQKQLRVALNMLPQEVPDPRPARECFLGG